MHEPAELRSQTIRRTGEKKNFTNVTMKGQDKEIELSAWGPHAATMSCKTGDFRLDAVSINPAAGTASGKMSTSDCSFIRQATTEETSALHSTLAPEDSLQNLTKQTFVPKRERESEMAKEASVTNSELLKMSLESEFDPSVAGQGDIFQDI